MMTLDEFLLLTFGNAYVTSPGFSELYVRIGPRYLGRVLYPRVLDIARVTVPKTRRGKGIFTEFLSRLYRQGVTVYVESIINPRLTNHLLELGFIRQCDIESTSLYRIGV
jgi:hypothetical protein